MGGIGIGCAHCPWELLSNVRCPTLVIAGEDDPICPLPVVEGLVEQFTGVSDVELLRLAGARHAVFRDAPDVAFPALLRFLHQHDTSHEMVLPADRDSSADRTVAMNDEDEDWVDPFGEAVDRLNAAGVTLGGPISGASVVGGPRDLAVHGPERLRLEYRHDLADEDLERIKQLMGDVPYELAHVTFTNEGKWVLDDGTVIGGLMYLNNPDE